MSNDFIKLEWDSDFFGFNVARINAIDIDEKGLSSLLHDLKSRGYRMVSWHFPCDRQDIACMALSRDGFLADEKITFVKELASADQSLLFPSHIIVPYPDNEPSTALMELALQSGEYSRFRLDPKFPRELFEKLYTCWITRSVRKEIAWQVLVVKDADKILGLITLGTKDDRGAIGLVAVSEQARGRGVGKLLVTVADRCFGERGFAVSQVVTQRANVGACRLYEACGYRVEKIESIIHFWL